MKNLLIELKNNLTGELYFDLLHQNIYATDASVYRELPLAVTLPKNEADIKKIIHFATQHNTSIIPRAAGTSLAGQCVGNGIVVDCSKYFNQIIALDKTKKTVKVQPGVIRDDLNQFLAPHGLFFGPNTSTSNRCTIGGMFGNNSSGTTSIRYGVTRDHIVAAKIILADASSILAHPISKNEWNNKLKQQDLEGKIYQGLNQILSDSELKEAVRENFPKPEIHRRNTGYAIDSLLDSELFSNKNKAFNLCNLLAGSEGTLGFTTEITLQLSDLPPSKTAMFAAHFDSIEACLDAVQPLMNHHLYTCEMMDKTILDCTKDQSLYQQNRFFLEGDPAAILLLEIKADEQTELSKQERQLKQSLQKETKAYAYPILRNNEIELALNLRKAGLGLLGNLNGDKKAVACIEDTAVALTDFSTYINEFTEIMKSFGQQSVYYAHAGAGELHLRPILNLKIAEDVLLFQQISEAVAKLVKKYQGSLSGEHGDGKVRSSFLPMFLGEKCYSALVEIKQIFDPNAIFNPNKIIEPEAITSKLRYETNRIEPEILTQFNFEKEGGLLRAAEKCNGSGDCRKSVEAGGGMCPSFRATKDEKDTTRARANALREFLTHSNKSNKFDHKELKNVFDLCVSCKACKHECPSNVDVASYKSEFLYQYQKANGVSLRDRLFAHINQLNAMMSLSPKLFNWLNERSFIKSFLNISTKRNLPKLAPTTLRKLIEKGEISLNAKSPQKGELYLFIDEFTNFYEVQLGKDCISLLTNLGYQIHIVQHKESGRSYISKGFLEEAKQIANHNIAVFSDVVTDKIPLIGIEPSAVLSFRDEYLRLADDADKAKKLQKNVFLIEEFLDREINSNRLREDFFTDDKKEIKVHIHCHQKALSSQIHTFNILNLPKNYTVKIIPSGCCGMAGSFGYEKEHFEISQQMGELQLFPSLRKASENVIIAANGTSCRHQIKDGTQRVGYHPISILKNALRN
ncbi:MAG: FAD-binding and (Fe-S)-binding domain-containing protein [Bacteroidota bacterium]